MGTDIVLAIGYGTYKLTAEDTKAYQLVNSLDPYYKAEIDAANNRYCVVSAQVIGAEVYMNDSTMSTNPGNDANDGLTPQTPVAILRARQGDPEGQRQGEGRQHHLHYERRHAGSGHGVRSGPSRAFRTPCFRAISTAAPARPSGSRVN